MACLESYHTIVLKEQLVRFFLQRSNCCFVFVVDFAVLGSRGARGSDRAHTRPSWGVRVHRCWHLAGPNQNLQVRQITP